MELNELLVPLANEIAPEEIVTHYVLSRKGFNHADLRIKPRELEPDRDNELSVFRTLGLQEPEIWEIGRVYVAEPLQQNIHARADIPVIQIISASLDIRSDEPPPRHAVVTEWPKEKDARISLAQELAADIYVIKNPNVHGAVATN